MTFGERLALCIEKAGLNQKQLAEIMDVTPTRLHYWVRDKREPDISHIRELSNALGVTADYLIGNVDEDTLSEAALHIAKAYDRMSDYGKAIIHCVVEQERCATAAPKSRVIPVIGEADLTGAVETRYAAKREAAEMLEESQALHRR